MHATRPSRPPLRTTTPIRKQGRLPRSQRNLHPGRRSERAIAMEVMTKLGVNLILMATAASALMKLLPNTTSRHEKLQELQTEVAHVETRVDLLQANFSRVFDPQQSQSNMQDQSNRLAPGQRQIILIRPSNSSHQPLSETAE